jgi:hypothetical protein
MQDQNSVRSSQPIVLLWELKFANYSMDSTANDRRSTALSEVVGVEMANKDSPAAVERTMIGPGNGEIFYLIFLFRAAI